jgi:uncharacterized protein
MQINIRRFGSPTREMVGILQSPNADRPQRAAFLMCRPFGQEAIRTAPIFRAMSDRLSREGCTVLTFDHHGCGDSPGELDDQCIDDWAADTRAAQAQLLADAPGAPQHWFGMGLGANIASCAALMANPVPSCLVLWEPVLDGPAYLDRLKTMHRHELAREMGMEWHQLVGRGREREPEIPGSVLGHAIGLRLHGELVEIGELPLAALLQRGIKVVLVVPRNQRGAVDGLAQTGLVLQSIEDETNWMSTEAFGTAIVPQEVPRTLLATL